MPNVAIVVRTKDRPALLARALADIVAQTFTDWRVIVVNDGGDPTVVEAAVHAIPVAFGDRVSVRHLVHARGMEFASRTAIEEATERYIAIHDDDDTWHPAFLARTVELLEGDQTIAGVAVRTDIVWEEIDDAGELVEISREPFLPLQTGLFLGELIEHNRWVPISFLFRRELVERIGNFRADLPVVGDWDFHLRALAAGERLAFVTDETLAFWHQRPSAKGAEGNSVIVGRDLHQHYDKLLRHEYLTRYVQQEGLGLPLLMADLSSRTRAELRELRADLQDELAKQRRLLESLEGELHKLPRSRFARFVSRLRRDGRN